MPLVPFKAGILAACSARKVSANPVIPGKKMNHIERKDQGRTPQISLVLFNGSSVFMA